MKALRLLFAFVLAFSSFTPFTVYAGAPALPIIDWAHEHVHRGEHWFLTYSVADLGAATTPNDTMTLSFTTGSKTLHFLWSATSSSGARARLIQGKTGGGTGATGSLAVRNNNLSVDSSADVEDMDNADGWVSYDALLFTGGTTLIDVYIGADGLGNQFHGGESRGDQEILLKPNTDYQLSILETDNVPGTLQISFYD